MTSPSQKPNKDSDRMNRREFVRRGGCGLAVLLLSFTAGVYAVKGRKAGYVWQLDPDKCIQCGNCETACVMTLSAVKAVHAHDLCGYCKLCGGYHHPQASRADTAAENQVCPTGAIQRTLVDDPFYEYRVVEELCTGCGKCVRGCGLFGNGAMYLQVRHDRCVNCNQCAIARVCPAAAFRRVPVSDPYIAGKKRHRE